MAKLPQVDENSFRADVLESTQPVLVDFSAVWCAPCRALAPIVEKLSIEWAGRVKVVTLDVDDNPAITARYGVMSIPTLILFKAGQPVARLNGLTSREKILAQVAPHMA